MNLPFSLSQDYQYKNTVTLQAINNQDLMPVIHKKSEKPIIYLHGSLSISYKYLGHRSILAISV